MNTLLSVCLFVTFLVLCSLALGMPENNGKRDLRKFMDYKGGILANVCCLKCELQKIFVTAAKS
jgi:hypothetical protein